MGYFLLKHHFTKSKSKIFFALIVPSLAHFAYNFVVLKGELFILIIFILLMLGTNLIILRNEKKKQLKIK